MDRLTLIRGAELHAPEPLGRRDVLLAGERILAVEDRLDPSGVPLETIDAHGAWLLPGFVDALTHPCGGGGEGGFGNRTGEIGAEDFVRAGVTSPVGALGTDSITRRLEVLYGSVQALRAAGLSAYMYSGSYRVPAPTLTGDLAKDLVLIEPVIGVGEVAVSDHRSSQPTSQELRRLAADVGLGGVLSGKRGVVFVHMGDGAAGLAPLEEALAGTELPRHRFYPTHLNRNGDLLRQAVHWTREGGFADITVATTPELVAAGDIPALEALQTLIDAGAPADRLTCSSDAGGSLPLYRNGELAGLQEASPRVLKELLREAAAVGEPTLGRVIAALTVNPARALGLTCKGRVAAGMDADLLLYDPIDGEFSEVFCRGRRLLRKGVMSSLEP